MALILMRTFVVSLAFSGTAAASDGAVLPPEVQTYIADRELCDHFREEPADGGTREQDERREFVRDSIDLHCAGTDRRLAALKKRYADEPEVQSRLAGYEAEIEAPCQ